jgi:hypothetical protein
MHAHDTVLRVLCGVLVLVALTAAGAAADKAASLGGALAELTSLRTAIDGRILFAEGKRREFETERNQLRAEIMAELGRLEAASLRQVQTNKRIEYDLRLVQQVAAVIDQLERRIDYFRSAIETLDFYGRQIRDEMAYLRTVSDVDVSRLLDPIRAAIDEYSQQADKPLVRMSELSIRSTESITAEMVGQSSPAPAANRAKAVSGR